MDNTKISRKQMQAMIAMFVSGSSLITGSLNQTDQNSWLTIVFAYVLSIPTCWMFASLLKLRKDRDFFQGIIEICGKIPGRILCFLYALNAVYLSGQIIRILVDFIHEETIPETPMVFILAAIIGPTVYSLRHRLYPFVRLAKFALPFFVITLCLTFIFGMPAMDITNILPILHTGSKQIALGTSAYFSISFGELVFVLPALGALDHKEKILPVLLKGSIPGVFVLLIVSLRNILILGYTNGTVAFPSFYAASIIAIGSFFTRLEIIIGIDLLLAGGMKTAVVLFSSAKSFAAAFHLNDYEPLIGPCGLLTLTSALFAFNNTEEIFSWTRYFPFFSLPLQIFVPAILIIIGKIEQHVKQKKDPASKPQKSGESTPNPADSPGT